MQLAVLAGFVTAGLAPLLHHWLGARTALAMALLPASLVLWLLWQWPLIAAGETLLLAWPWVPALEISLTFFLDGLAWLFALLICAIGALVLVYSGDYLRDDPAQPRFLVLIVAFMMAMLGLVLADNLVTLFIFWELTSLTSYLLIGFHHTDPAARKAALQSLMVTAGGGLALLAGLVMLALAGGSWSLAELAGRGDAVQDHALHGPLLVCVLLGAFTKSAQWPFHFWLPNAMAAPTPVSAYLHSATMVKAGIYLLARLHPVLGSSDAWVVTLTLVGGLTMALGACLAIRQTHLKILLAYSTVMALGAMTLLLGIGTRAALAAFIVFLVAHALYKGALFLVAGILDQATGTRDLTGMGGLRHAMPWTALVAGLAALSLAGLPPLLGFIGKEALFSAVLEAPLLRGIALSLAFLAALLTLAVAALILLRPFFGARREMPRRPREGSPAMLAGPALLAGLSLWLGLVPHGLEVLVTATVQGLGVREAAVHLTLWHGVTLPLGLSLASLLLGALVVRHWDGLRARSARLEPFMTLGPEGGYGALMRGWMRLAEAQTRWLQNGHLRSYLVMTLLVLLGLVGHALFVRNGLSRASMPSVQLHEALVAALMVSGAVTACLMRSRLAAVAALGAMGFSIALTFVLFSAPDLAITQLLVETLTVVLLALVLYRLPRFAILSTPLRRLRDLVVASLVGGLVGLLMLSVLGGERLPRISGYMIANGQPLGHGHNLVNVILVDFRALDTLGEIIVLGLAATGVFAMLCLRPGSAADRRDEGPGENDHG
ncbi:putative monovalent cation/H+ antiporter subunit A [Halomonas nitroreducens]|uniref:Putative monovalent cation/H+ antiporter subunit A n=1 Tax=Halomonas nitroreducens TaxID=447425 RepID=A0A3S0HQ33_9GAMM|nr:putative monovalent cation/H+ antiporter subunit A [Halomonas nitroreducens]RTR03808.1 putative monovalent cation/H+ antiporter subunit A [Halomonas nitroreducens]